MSERSAIDTIKGYFYQFDYSIKCLLELKNDNDSIIIEGIEDIDIKTATEETAVQCKYYSKTEYNHSVIAKPLRLMLNHFKNAKDGKSKRVKYYLNGCYKSGHEKLKQPISVEFLKSNFLTYKRDNVTYRHYESLGLTDDDLREFISLLSININATDYDSQLNSILELLKKQFGCSDFEAENYYYNNALNIIKSLAIENAIEKRRITKKRFLQLIDNKKFLFNIWFIKYKGKKSYLKELRRNYFSSLNASPFERFFLIEVPPSDSYNRAELKELLMIISEKYSRLSKREKNPFCPYVLLFNISNQELINLKTDLHNENFIFKDGFDFYGAEFNPKSITIEANHYNNIRLKIISNFPQLELTLKEITKTKEIYQFYISKPLLKKNYETIKQVNIQIEELRDIKEVI
ncbi:DUF4297 family anti-phage-associated protein [Caldifermentibacillus hisashii]|uniref:DUF4297 family anti-phage-associated protein n=1 Tax=Caldifermentibacillus hisashii TaxID=996558 RepID=UPI003365F5CD